MKQHSFQASHQRELANSSLPHLTNPVIITFQVTTFLSGISSNRSIASPETPLDKHIFKRAVCT